MAAEEFCGHVLLKPILGIWRVPLHLLALCLLPLAKALARPIRVERLRTARRNLVGVPGDERGERVPIDRLPVTARGLRHQQAASDHDAWVAEWRWALGCDYDPSVDVRTIKNERAHAVAEVSKYAVKPGEWVNLDDADGTDSRVELLALELKGRRLVAFGGLMMQARKLLKQEDAETADLVHTGEDAEVRGDLLVALDRFEWQVGVTNYVHVKRDVLVELPSE